MDIVQALGAIFTVIFLGSAIGLLLSSRDERRRREAILRSLDKELERQRQEKEAWEEWIDRIKRKE